MKVAIIILYCQVWNLKRIYMSQNEADISAMSPFVTKLIQHTLSSHNFSDSDTILHFFD